MCTYKFTYANEQRYGSSGYWSDLGEEQTAFAFLCLLAITHILLAYSKRNSACVSQHMQTKALVAWRHRRIRRVGPHRCVEGGLILLVFQAGPLVVMDAADRNTYNTSLTFFIPNQPCSHLLVLLRCIQLDHQSLTAASPFRPVSVLSQSPCITWLCVQEE